MGKLIKARSYSTFQIIMMSFMAVILAGTFLLMLPVSSADGIITPFQDALFTATSAVCVTGLIVRDTATYWSAFGQSVILIMIQIGGMGVITLVIAVTILTGKKIGLMQRQTMQEAVAAQKIGGIVKLTQFILKVVFVSEGIGAVLLLPGFMAEYGILKGIWYSVFHSISAFCNAGFDLMGHKEQFSSLTSYQSNPVINLVIMGLIVAGGLGFLTWEDIKTNKRHFYRYRMQSKVILTTTALLIFLPAVYFFFFEYGELPIGTRILSSLFQSVTTRTAGFNTSDLTKMSDTGILTMILLMLIGGSPGSTAGGMKTTTFAVMMICAMSVFKRHSSMHIFGRRFSDEVVRNVAAIFVMYIVLCLGAGCVISTLDHVPMLTALFETASAVGTVGLTLGLTTKLCLVSRLILIGLMFFGRVGGLTLIYAALADKSLKGNHYPQEKIMVG